MVARLADTLGMPLRERNTLLLAAGYAPEFPETTLSAADLARVRGAIDLILEHQEPYPAFVFNRHMDILMTNEAAVRLNRFLCGGSAHANMLRAFFDPKDLRAYVVNWEEVAGNLIRHLHEDIAAAPSDTKGSALLNEILRYPGVPSRWRNADNALAPLLTVVFRKDDCILRFFSTFTRFGTPRDITLDELRIECTFPADEATAELCRRLAAGC